MGQYKCEVNKLEYCEPLKNKCLVMSIELNTFLFFCHNDLLQDYDRDPEILMHLEAYKVLVLCSKLQIIPCRGCTEDSFKLLLKELLDVK